MTMYELYLRMDPVLLFHNSINIINSGALLPSNTGRLSDRVRVGVGRRQRHQENASVARKSEGYTVDVRDYTRDLIRRER